MKTLLSYLGTCCCCLLSIDTSGKPQAPVDQNYIKTRTYCTPNGQTYYDDIQYYDGLGKPYMVVNIKATAANKDLISLTEYDGLGRKSLEWMPVPIAASNGYAAPDNIKSVASSREGYDDEIPFTSYGYENSPEARVLEVRAPGRAFQLAQPSIGNAYLLNDTTDSLNCLQLAVDITMRTVRNNGIAASGMMFATRTEDADGHVVYEFKNVRGERVLTRQKSDNGTFADTYYVYDDRGNLCFVLPPELSATLSPGTSFTVENPIFAAYGYSYEYDGRNRCAGKKLPGADWIYYGYDRTDRLVLTQDGELRNKGQWLVTLYDALGRIVIRGLSSNPELSADKYTSQTVQAEFDPVETTTYCYVADSSISLSELMVTEVHYYDNYRYRTALPTYFGSHGYVPLSGYGERFGTDTDEVAAKGLETGCLYGVIPDADIFLGTSYYYDAKNRMIQRKVQTMHGGFYSEDIAYDFMGNVLKRRESCRPRTGVSADVLISDFTYDDRNRLLNETVILNGAAAVPTSYSYDDFGHLISTTQGSEPYSITTTRQYNIRNWLTAQQNSLFEMTFTYNTPRYSTTKPLYTGNITELTWKHGDGEIENTYAFTYDKFSRLSDAKQYVDGIASDLFVEKNLSYDRNGNIRTLYRTESGQQSNALSYGYTGNQLLILSDGSADYTYAYDRNGNMTHDGLNNLDVSYNHLNLIEKVVRNDTIVAKYSYLSNGMKLSATDADDNGLEYQGSLVYKKQGNDISLESAGFSGGRFISTTGGVETYYHLTDHLGSVRVVVNPHGEIIERNDYYPFGLRWNNTEQRVSDNRYRYNGKEHQSFLNTPYIDYGARQYDPEAGVWHSPDPLSEKYFSVSPFAFCSGNPIYLVDSDGRKVSISNLSSTHQKSLQIFMSSPTGMEFIGRYMSAGESLTVNGQTYTFNQTGDRAKDLLLMGSVNNLGAEGNNSVFVKNSNIALNNIAASDVQNIVRNGVKQQILLDGKLDEKKAVVTLGHEVFVHADKDADALTELENNPQMQSAGNIMKMQDANSDHKALGNGLVTKFKQLMKEITTKTRNKYYEQEYQKQVQRYKNQSDSDY